jgi:hypothetical protein
LSFFDDDDEPTQRTAAQPRRAPAGSRSGGGGGGGRQDPHERQQLLVRRAIAAGVGLVIVIVLVLGIKACLDSSNEDAMKNYNTQVTGIAKSSDSEVTGPLFTNLKSGGAGQDLQQQINGYRLIADENVKRAKALDVPDDMKRTQQYVVQALNFRSEALANIAAQIPAATSTKGDPTTAVNKIAGQMQALLASDVIWSQRVVPYMTDAFDNAGIGGQVIPASRSLNNLSWLAPATVATALGATLSASSSSSAGAGGSPCTTTCGHGLDGVSVGGVDLQPAPAANKPSNTAPVTFDVKFSNQGQQDEARVPVTVTITGAGVKTITARGVVAQTKAGTPAEVQIPLTTPPPANKVVKIVVQVLPVPGEKDTTNNSGTYDAVFTAG